MIVYTKTGCPWCIDAVNFLKENNISFEERNVTDSPEYMEEMVKKSGQSKAPTFDVDGAILPDFSAEEIESYLKEKGLLD